MNTRNAGPGNEGPFAASAAFAARGEGPIPFSHSAVELPPFPVESFPPAYADMIRELAEATQTDPAMAGTSALAVLAACSGGHARIEIRRGWVEPLCLFLGTVARPGERKSAIQSAMTRPLNQAEAEMGFAGEIERLAKQNEFEMAKKKAEKLANAAATAAVTAAKPDATEEQKAAAEAAEKAALEAQAEARAITVPTVPRLLADDVTPEAASSLLADNNGRIAIISAEGGLFDILAGRYANKVNLDPFLKGHAGDTIRVDRKGRAPEHVPNPALTLGLMFQPSVLTAIAENRDFAGRGLLARFLYSRPESKVGQRKTGATPVSRMTESNYNCAVLKLASDMAKWVGDPGIVQLSPEAEEQIRAVEEWIEPQLAGDGPVASLPTLTEWASKYAGAVARISGLLHLALHGENGVRTPVDADTVEAASKIGQYYMAAAINTFGEMGTDEATSDALYILDKIRCLGAEIVSVRDVFNVVSRSRFRSTDGLVKPFKRLVEHGYLIPLPRPKTGGRPPSPRYRVVATEATEADE